MSRKRAIDVRPEAHRRRDLAECPNCGADVPAGARACRECGSDADTGWKSGEEIDYESVDLPQGYAQDEQHPGGAPSSRTPRWIVATSLLVLAAIALAAGYALWRLLR